MRPLTLTLSPSAGRGKLAAALAIVALTACASATDVKRDGFRYEMTLEQPPHLAGRCINLNMAGLYTWLRASHSSRPDGTVDVVGYEFDRVIFVMELTKKGQGSAATVWMTRANMPLAESGTREKLLHGC